MTLRQCAAVLLQNSDGQILMVKQNYGQRFWSLPGGVVDPGETPLQAAIREAHEEAGISIALQEVLGLYLLQGGGWPDIQAYVFRAHILDDEPRIMNPQEIAELRWMDLQALPDWVPRDVSAAFEDLQMQKQGVIRTVQRIIPLERMV
ncbi:NUDIX hydrolase [Deinococcus aquatilis]|uniref:NUDIX hydrolase n=1 Tax=Deinococcus aquatilis TaxID=519440 RepID=UPI00035E1E3E|nr:NUDIX hydrolase [Deinococcus aquatilis]